MKLEIEPMICDLYEKGKGNTFSKRTKRELYYSVSINKNYFGIEKEQLIGAITQDLIELLQELNKQDVKKGEKKCTRNMEI